MVLLVARVDRPELPAAAFHLTEVDRVAQLVRAAAVILGDRLDLVSATPEAAATALSARFDPDSWKEPS